MSCQRCPQNCQLVATTSGLKLRLLLLLLFTIVPRGDTQPSTIVLTGACKNRCDQARPHDKRGGPFDFTCEDKGVCPDECETCPREVCDETLSEDSWRNWHCPQAEMDPKCWEQCNKHRPKGDRQAYSCTHADCTSISQCTSFKDQSTGEVKCPEDKKLEGPCKLECDKARVHKMDDDSVSFIEPFAFNCDQFHAGNSAGETLCRDTCKNNCPAYICDANADPNSYHCPAADGSDLKDDCRDFCKRLTSSSSSSAKTINCIDEHKSPSVSAQQALDKCKDLCKSCPTPVNYVCDEADPKFFYCPEIPDEQQPKGRAYKGPCKARCDAGQGGGPHKYNLTCVKTYTTSEEQQACRQVCTDECPADLCETNGGVIKCQGNKKQLASMEKTETEKELEQYRKGSDYRELSEAFLLTVVLLGVLVAILLLGWIIYACCMKKKMRRLQMKNEEAPPPPPPPTGSEAGKGDAKKEEAELANSKTEQKPEKPETGKGWLDPINLTEVESKGIITLSGRFKRNST